MAPTDSFADVRPAKLLKKDCLTKGGEPIRPCIPSPVAYEVGRVGNDPSKPSDNVPTTARLAPEPGIIHENRETSDMPAANVCRRTAGEGSVPHGPCVRL